MSLTLAIDTATRRTGISLATEAAVIAQYYEEGATAHGEALSRLASQLLQGIDRSEITSVAVGIGPGPFTGLRVGISFAQSFAFALGVPLISVCTLDVIAAEVSCNQEFAIATDARRKEVYWARYSAAGKRLGEVRVIKPSELTDEERWLPTAGDAVEIYGELFPFLLEPLFPNMGLLAARAAEFSLADHAPMYMRRPDATPPVLP
ncbi:MAG: tRNA (adenosine(37)-N6)-threonylcarbamoyltransferase complex dimerization subunit type 1 TsaB [Actinobacteria bacterium]|jgi:tRNA threonylcarbamoyl adenosine modification protein YeaZ|nr:tRNA (adenosine(37)-N6)-threonylcarbamoyltransferase complex dimerization subunit type 1 TsaB [Actinomycetota bacterium]